MESIIDFFQLILLLLTHSLVLFIGVSFGLAVADIDQNLPFIKHRSVWTHGPIWPAVIFLEPIDTSLTRYFLLGFFLAYAIHLVYDLYPSRWVGIAKIHLWHETRLSPLSSFLWIASGVFVSLLLVVGTLTKYPAEYPLVLVLAPLLLLSRWHTEKRVLGPTVTFLITTVVIVGTTLSLPDIFIDFRQDIVQAAGWEE